MNSQMNSQQIKLSKFLSLVLRHKPETIGLTLNEAGWASLDELIRCAASAGKTLTRKSINEVVTNNDKQRFAISDDGQYIRANQGHSVAVQLGLTPLTPPTLLYHGTATRFLASIFEQGLKPGNRQHVHLSADEATAIKVGKRHGKPIVLLVDAEAMQQQGYLFYRSENGVWLTDRVPPSFLKSLEATNQIQS